MLQAVTRNVQAVPSWSTSTAVCLPPKYRVVCGSTSLVNTRVRKPKRLLFSRDRVKNAEACRRATGTQKGVTLCFFLFRDIRNISCQGTR